MPWWAVIEPVLPAGTGRRGRPRNDHRRTLEPIACRFRTSAPWRACPTSIRAHRLAAGARSTSARPARRARPRLPAKAYSRPTTRARLRKAKIAHRNAKGARSGQPPSIDADTYRHRNTVERGLNKLNHWRDIATRYDNHALTHLGGVTLAAIVIHHRALSRHGLLPR